MGPIPASTRPASVPPRLPDRIYRNFLRGVTFLAEYTAYTAVDAACFMGGVAYPTVDAAYSKVYAAYTAVDAAYTVVDAAYTVVDAAYTVVDAAYTVVDAAYTEVYTAYTTRDAAYTVGNAASTAVNTAKKRDLAAFGGIIGAMASDLAAIVASLESRLAFHQEQARHLEEQKSKHEVEIETISRKLATFKAALSEVESLHEVMPPAHPESDPQPGGKVYIARLVTRVVEDLPAGEPFGISAVTQEVNRRYREHLPQPVEPRQVSVVLRWMLRTGRIRSFRKGKPFHEALYTKDGL